ncbi:MAG: type I glutamate--ammonia ligase [Anaerolineae bacterium]|nr:type I glutamate--ammonia ligase [Chloroflexota bacterium]
MAKSTKEDVVRACLDQDVRFLHLQFSDILGMIKNITVPVSQLDRILENGLWFDGSSIHGFARVSESDMFLFPDLDTFAVIPWQNGAHQTGRLICDVFAPDGTEFMGSPRSVLKAALRDASEMGYGLQVGPELEFFLFDTDERGMPVANAMHDQAGYFDASTDRAVLVRQEMSAALEAFGIEVQAEHHESAPSQHEIDFRYDHALASADAALTFKYVLKAIAQEQGLYATFMPKPIAGIAGSGMHVHQNLTSLATGANVFSDPADRYGLSQLAKHYLAGQLRHARAMSVVLAPLVNSYKRLVPGFEAPVYVSWARINRSSLIRIPKARTPASARLELRFPDPACNPYLAFAVMLQCGLDGIRNELPLGEPSERNLFESDVARAGLEVLPGSLKEAIDAACEDEVVQRALGPHIWERYIDAKLQEWDNYRLSVSQWELDRYLAVY